MASSMGPTFVASLRAVGTASTMAFAGFYLHRRGFVTASGKKMMALLSQQVTIPAFLFAKIIYCPSGNSGSGSISNVQNDIMEIVDNNEVVPEIVCPSVANRISDLWMLLLWPFYVVFCGLCTGYFAARISKTTPVQVRSCLAACAFGNSTGLVITLLTVIHDQFSKNTEFGRIDPTTFLSVYLLLYPVLQWGVGGWLLAPGEKVENNGTSEKISEIAADNKSHAEATPLLPYRYQESLMNQLDNEEVAGRRQISYHISHILNYEPVQSPIMSAVQQEFGGVRYRGTSNGKSGHGRYADSESSVLAMMVRELSFTSASQLHSKPSMVPSSDQNDSATVSGDCNSNYGLTPETDLESEDGPLTMDDTGEATSSTDSPTVDVNPQIIREHVPFTNGHGSFATLNSGDKGYTNLPRVPSRQQIETLQKSDILPLTETLLRVLGKVFQPPVIGALLGLFIASFPNLRGLLENIWGDEVKTAPLHWLFDGIHTVGQAAVPVNMTILGINLSSTFQKKKFKKSGDKNDDRVNEKNNMLPSQTMFAVVIAKMIVMPIIGILSTWFLQKYCIDLPHEIDSTCYLVMMIVFITPTANNVMVMVELSGSSSKEGIARLIGWQYIVSPLVLSIVLSAVVSTATSLDNSN
mmetsp:Transcript_10630/g.23199  ORF Transcript_10630/g.23199 Transcript_10630/m.23199 type:complete len:638 (-) Transcript_10630:266-2179(-)